MPIGIGILGAGRIAEKMAHTLSLMEEVTAVAVGARDLTRAKDFAKRHAIKKAYGSYEELVADNNVELVYIATPHAFHYEHMMLCLRADKHILCEKAFTCTEDEAIKIFAEAKKRNLFVTEAMWTRYMPMVKNLIDIRNNCPLGDILTLTANLCYPVYYQKQRLQLPELGGGALLDIGIYPLTFASIIMGDDITLICNNMNEDNISNTGVDLQNTVTLHYGNSKTAVLTYSALSHSDRRGVLMCTDGYIEIENINNFESISLFGNNHKLLNKINRPNQLTGYEYEIRAAVKAIQNGELECEEMPHSETVLMMRLMDKIRYQCGVYYPADHFLYYGKFERPGKEST